MPWGDPQTSGSAQSAIRYGFVMHTWANLNCKRFHITGSFP